MSAKITVEIDVPETCSVCPFYSEIPYASHNERGMEANCSCGYMRGSDMRDNIIFATKRRWKSCRLEIKE